MRITAVLIAAVAATLSGCGANHHSIYRHQDTGVSTGTLTLVDSKQRAILGNRDGNTQRFCAEPSPDVLSVVAQALSASGSLDKSADPKQLEAALKATFGTSESASTIPRTQTIQVLRELMYRTCERHLNGGMAPLELTLQAVRDQRLMVSILAIEQLTGVVRPGVAGASSLAEGSAGSAGPEAALRMDALHQEVQTKAATLQQSQATYDQLNGTARTCQAIATAVANGQTDGLSEELKAQRAPCEQSLSTLAAARKEHADASEHLAAYLRIAGQATGSAQARSSAGAGALVATSARAHASADIAQVVDRIVDRTFNQDEFLLMCVKVMGGEEKWFDPETKKRCIDYINAGVERQTLLTLEASDAVRAEIGTRVSGLFDDFWRRVGNGDQVDAVKLSALRKPSLPACFQNKSTRADFKTCFESLRAQQQRDLAKE